MIRNTRNLCFINNVISRTSKSSIFQKTLVTFETKYNNVYKIASPLIVLAHPSRLPPRSSAARRSRVQRLKDDLNNSKNNSSQETLGNKENETSGSNKSMPDKTPDKNQSKIAKIIFFSLLGISFFFSLVKSNRMLENNFEISYDEFVNRILPTGCIQKIIVVSHLNLAYVYTFRNFKSSDGWTPEPFYTIGINDIRKFESGIRSVETELGVHPSNWTQIEYQEVPIASFIIFLLIFLGLAILLFRNRKNFKISFMDPFSMLKNTKFKIYDPNSKAVNINIKFKDVAGLHEAKVEVMEFVDYLKNPSKYTKLGAKLPKGAIMTGPPGCGKTLLAKALASESNVPFININGTEFVEMIGGLGASRVRDLFKEAKKRAPCMIYIDEIDAIGRKRQEGGSNMAFSNSEQEQTLNQLLVEMDGMNSENGIIVFASTNRPDVLDKALLRPGRFDRHVTVDLPTVAERKELFELYLKKIKLDKDPTYYSGRLAQMTPGMSGADISNIVNEAAINAATNQKTIVTERELSHAIERVIAGPEKRSRTLIKEEKETVAYHEAGHALVGWLLKYTDALLKVTIVPRTSAALGFAQYTPRDKKLFTSEELFDRMCMMLGGRAAENIYFGRITTGAQNDLEKVTKQAYAQVQIYGMNKNIGPLSFQPDELIKKPYGQELARIMDHEAKALVSKAYYTTEQLLRDNFDKLDILAKELLAKESLTYDEVKKLIGPPPFGDKDVIEMAEQALPNLEKNV